MSRKIPIPTRISDAVYLTSRHSGAHPEYMRGVLIGLVSGLMAFNYDYDDAIKVVVQYLPKDFDPSGLPTAWRADILKAVQKVAP